MCAAHGLTEEELCGAEDAGRSDASGPTFTDITEGNA